MPGDKITQLEVNSTVEYDFYSEADGSYSAQFSMGHEAIGHWLNQALAANTAEIDDLLSIVVELERDKRQDYQVKRSGFLLTISAGEVVISALAVELCDDEETPPENTEWYDQESKSDCGLDDFKAVLLDWRQFTLNR